MEARPGMAPRSPPCWPRRWARHSPRGGMAENAKPASDVASARLRARCPPLWAGRPCPEVEEPGAEAGAGSTPTRASEERVGADHAGVGRARVPPRRAADEGGSRDRPSDCHDATRGHARRAGSGVLAGTERSAGQLSDATSPTSARVGTSSDPRRRRVSAPLLARQAAGRRKRGSEPGPYVRRFARAASRSMCADRPWRPSR